MARGTLKQRAKGSWSIILDIGKDPETGKRRQQWVTVKGTKKEAEKKLNEMLHQIDTGSFVKPAKMTLGGFLQQWLSNYVATNVRSRTAEGYRTIINAQLIPHLGNIALTDLKPQHLKAYYAKALQSGRKDGKPGGLSARTVLHHHRVLSKALRHAVKYGLVVRNVAEAVDPPRPDKHEMQTLGSQGVAKLLEAARDTVYYPIIHLSVYTGLRRSEILGLRWKDVDLLLTTLSVTQDDAPAKGGRIIFQERKTVKSRCLVSLSPAAVIALRAHRERQEADRALLEQPLTEYDLVFANADGTPMLPDTISHAFTKLAKRAGLANLRLHDIRHTHASLMLKQEIHPKIVQERLGHATIATALDIYSHVAPSLQKAAALKFEEGLNLLNTEPVYPPETKELVNKAG